MFTNPSVYDVECMLLVSESLCHHARIHEILKFSKYTSSLMNMQLLIVAYFNFMCSSEILERKTIGEISTKIYELHYIVRYFGLNVNRHDCCEHKFMYI